MKKENRNWAELEQLLAKGNSIQIWPKGYSMYPLFRPEKDEAIISPVTGKLKRGEVVLYERMEGVLVLHRICKVNRKGYYMVGDNQYLVEGPIDQSQIKGILTEVIRDGEHFSVGDRSYRRAVRIWLMLRPFRVQIIRMISAKRRKENTTCWKKNSDVNWRDNKFN